MRWLLVYIQLTCKVNGRYFLFFVFCSLVELSVTGRNNKVEVNGFFCRYTLIDYLYISIAWTWLLLFCLPLSIIFSVVVDFMCLFLMFLMFWSSHFYHFSLLYWKWSIFIDSWNIWMFFLVICFSSSMNFICLAFF